MNIQEIGQDQETKFVEKSYRSPWADSPWFNPGQKENSEHEFAMTEGTEMSGVFHGLATTKVAKEADRRTYGKFIDKKGNYFRIRTPGQLEKNLSELEVGTYVKISYLGKVAVEGYKEPIHQFKIFLPEAKLN